MMKCPASVLIGIVLAAAITRPGIAAPPVEKLLHNVRAISTGGNPASLIVWGNAKSLIAAPDGRVFAAAAQLKAGRIVAVGHGGFTQTNDADSEVFTANVIEWLIGKKHKSHIPRIFGLSDPAADELTRRGIAFERIGQHILNVSFASTDVIIASTQQFAKAGRFAELKQWISRGGGFLATETAWGTLQLNPDLTLDTLAANRLLEAVSIRFTGESHSPFGPDGAYPVHRALLDEANADFGLQILTGDRDGDQVFAARIVGDAFSNVPLSSPLIKKAKRIARAHRAQLDQAYRNLKQQPITPKNNPLARALIDLDSRLARELPPQQVKAHPSSAAFPGPLGKARAGRVTIKLDTRVPGWHTTGLYAPPGKVITITVPEEATDIGVFVQIGAWRDPHSHPYRVRLKDALRRFPIDSRVTKAASAIGGPVYIDLPTGFADTYARKELIVKINGAAKAPHYKYGVTDLEAWRNKIRLRPVPWAEIESNNLILTVPSAAIRDVDRPDLVMEHWDKVHEAMQSLEPRTGNHWADRPYRYVADVSVSWGYMYCPADGPLTIPVSTAAAMFQLENFDATGENKLWGHYHEMGHAHQNPLWTDNGTGEVTVNIFTVYALHTINGYPLDSKEMRSDPQTAWNTFNDHRKSGKTFEESGGPFKRLQFYALLWHEFGFDAFRTTFSHIRQIPTEKKPQNKTEERNLFLVQFSQVVGRNLASYFEAWGITVTNESRQQLQSLPDWMPVAPQSPRPDD